MPTQEEVDRLKANWTADPCFDLEDVEGFEDHRKDLLAFSEAKKAEWRARNEAEIEKARTWQQVNKGGGEYTERMQVPGGWLVRVTMYSTVDGEATAVSLAFLPDASHSWRIA